MEVSSCRANDLLQRTLLGDAHVFIFIFIIGVIILSDTAAAAAGAVSALSASVVIVPLQNIPRQKPSRGKIGRSKNARRSPMRVLPPSSCGVKLRRRRRFIVVSQNYKSKMRCLSGRNVSHHNCCSAAGAINRGPVGCTSVSGIR